MNARVRPSCRFGLRRSWAAAVCAGAVCIPFGSAAQTESDRDEIAALMTGSTGYAEVTTDIPRLDFNEPAGTRVESTRWRYGPGGTAYGVALGVSARPSALVPSATVLRPSVGLRFRSRVGEGNRLDVATWHDLPPQREANFAYAQSGAPERLTTTRVEMQFAPPKGSGLGLDMGGAVGFQMSANAKLQLRIRKGGPMFYYRSKF
jgi:hypothetical protein